jgi:outer membrane protein TolC
MTNRSRRISLPGTRVEAFAKVPNLPERDNAAIRATAEDAAPPSIEIPAAVPAASVDYPIDLSAALRLADVENPNIGEARARIGEALAVQQQAKALLLPTLNAGTTYHGHTGNLQRSSGRISSLSEQSLYFGGGASTLGTQTVGIPAIRIFSPITDAIYEPLAARQRVDGARFSALATTNSILLEVVTLYLELQGTEARLAAARATASEAAAIAGLTKSYSDAGKYPEADADRATTELKLFQSAVQRAEEEVAVASARLVRRLHIDPNVRVHADGTALEPITLIEAGQPVEGLILTAIRSRPEMRATGAAVAEAEIHLRQEKARPFLPTVSAGFSGGGFGGGSNLIPPNLGHFAGRTDADVFAFWTLQNFGFGNAAIQKNRRAAIGQAEAQRSTAANTIRREVMQAVALSAARLREIEIDRVELASAEAGYREDLARARGAVGRPIEVLDSLKLLNRARQNLIRATVGFDQAQFALFVALGSPPPTGPAAGPLPPVPLASPPMPR